MDEKQTPVAIRIGKGGKLNASGNTVGPGVRFLEAEELDEANLQENRIAGFATEPPKAHRLVEVLKWLGGIAAALIAAYVTYRLGWNK